MKKTVTSRKVGAKKQHTSFIKKVSTKTENMDEFKAFFKGIKPVEEKIFNYIDEFENIFRSYLEDRGLPSIYPKCYSIGNPPDGGAHLPEILKYKLKSQEVELEPEWYAATVLVKAHDLRGWIDKGDLFESIQSAILMAQAKERFNLSNFESQIIAGNSRTSEASKGKKSDAKEARGFAKKIFEEHLGNGHTRSRAAELTSKYLQNNHDIKRTPRTIREWKTKNQI